MALSPVKHVGNMVSHGLTIKPQW